MSAYFCSEALQRTISKKQKKYSNVSNLTLFSRYGLNRLSILRRHYVAWLRKSWSFQAFESEYVDLFSSYLQHFEMVNNVSR